MSGNQGTIKETCACGAEFVYEGNVPMVLERWATFQRKHMTCEPASS